MGVARLYIAFYCSRVRSCGSQLTWLYDFAPPKTVRCPRCGKGKMRQVVEWGWAS